MKKVFAALFLFTASAYGVAAQKLYQPSCTTLSGKAQLPAVDTTPGRNVANPYLVWDNDEPISIKFLGMSSPALQAAVTRYAKEWEQVANIKFQFVDGATPVTNLRIKLGQGKGHNSYIGINCNEVAQTEQTMNLDTVSFLDYSYYIADMKKRGIQPNMEELNRMVRLNGPRWDYREMRKTVLHEFGHALGLLHEQSYPGAIKWKKDTVYKYYLKTQGWDKAKTESQVFLAREQFYTNGTQYDAKSIMHYPIEAWQTTDGFATPDNFDLSAGDKALVAALYPPAGTVNDKAVPRVTIQGLTLLDVVNDSARGGILIYPSFDLRTSAKLGTVYVVAMLVGEDNRYIKDDNNFYNWGGYVAVYPRLTLLPNSKAAYNKTKRNLELFLPYSEIPVPAGQKVKLQLRIALDDKENNQLIYVTNRLSDKLYSISKR